MKILILFFITIINSCGSSPTVRKEYFGLSEPIKKDYVDHLASLGPVYLKSDDVKEVKLNADSIQFLEKVFERITINNEIILSRDGKPKFHFIINKTPFIFSLPNYQFFISSGLVEKYLKSEDLFVAAVSAEILKSDRYIYEKKMIIPLGYLTTEQMLKATRLRSETKFQINEWSYFVLKRAGFDASAFLNWIQVQNRNTLDFSLYLGDSIGISKEEHYFKNFMTKQGIASVEKKINEANSSKAFYNLINNIARVK